jgi:hypothetical protein
VIAAGQYGNTSSANKPAICVYVLDVFISLSGAKEKTNKQTNVAKTSSPVFPCSKVFCE